MDGTLVLITIALLVIVYGGYYIFRKKILDNMRDDFRKKPKKRYEEF